MQYEAIRDGWLPYWGISLAHPLQALKTRSEDIKTQNGECNPGRCGLYSLSWKWQGSAIELCFIVFSLRKVKVDYKECPGVPVKVTEHSLVLRNSG
jgi:hypothetical protein